MSTILFTSPPQLTIQSQFFDLSVFVTSSEKLTGIDFSFLSSNATLVSRDLSTSDFPDVISSSLDNDLGASVNDVSDPLLPGTHKVADFHFRVEGLHATVIPRQHPSTIGYVTEAPAFIEKPFDEFQGSEIFAPEPSFIVAVFVILLKGFRR